MSIRNRAAPEETALPKDRGVYCADQLACSACAKSRLLRTLEGRDNAVHQRRKYENGIFAVNDVAGFRIFGADMVGTSRLS